MIIDVHTHIFPEKIAESAVKSLADRSGLTPYHNGRLEELLKLMEEGGVDYSVIQSIATNPRQNIKVNDFAISLLKVPGIIPFGSIHPELEDWEKEIERLKEAGIKGIKFHPDYQDFFVDEERMIPVYRKIFSMDMAILFHSGVDIGLPDPVHCTPERVNRIIGEFEGKKVIFAHMGAHLLWDDVEKYMLGKDFYIDTSFSVDEMEKERAVRMIEKHGTDKVLFGTDSPWKKQKPYVEYIRGLGLSKEDTDKILGLNAEKLLL